MADRPRATPQGKRDDRRTGKRPAPGPGTGPSSRPVFVPAGASTAASASGFHGQVTRAAEVIYGRHAVLESLRAGRRHFYRVHLEPGIAQTGIIADILAAARSRGYPVIEAPAGLLDRLGAVNHQGVAAETGPYPYADLDTLLAQAVSPDALYLVLDHLQDVQNLATLLRTAEAMAVTGVILPERRAAGITAAVVNGSAGAVEHLPIVLVANVVQSLERLKQVGVWVAGLDAGQGAIPLAQADLTGRLALVVGAEGPGLSRLVREHCDWVMAIPMYGQVASLNAAVAGSIALVAARQARDHDRARVAPAPTPAISRE